MVAPMTSRNSAEPRDRGETLTNSRVVARARKGGALPHPPHDVAVEGGGLAQAVDVVDELPRREQAPRGRDAGEGLDVGEAAGPQVHDGLEVDLDPPVRERFGHPGETLVVRA